MFAQYFHAAGTGTKTQGWAQLDILGTSSVTQIIWMLCTSEWLWAQKMKCLWTLVLQWWVGVICQWLIVSTPPWWFITPSSQDSFRTDKWDQWLMSVPAVGWYETSRLSKKVLYTGCWSWTWAMFNFIWTNTDPISRDCALWKNSLSEGHFNTSGFLETCMQHWFLLNGAYQY